MRQATSLNKYCLGSAVSTPQTRPKWAGELTYTLPGPLVRPAIWFLGYKQVAPLGQGYRMEVDLVAQGMFMGRTDGETGWGIPGLQTGCPDGTRVSNGDGFGCSGYVHGPYCETKLQ